MTEFSPSDFEQTFRKSHSGTPSAIEPQSPTDATENGIWHSCLAVMADDGSQDFRGCSCHDAQGVPTSMEHYEIITRLRLVGQSSQQPTKGVLQVNQTHTDFNFQSGYPWANSKPDPPKIQKLEESIWGRIESSSVKAAVNHCISISYNETVPNRV